MVAEIKLTLFLMSLALQEAHDSRKVATKITTPTEERLWGRGGGEGEGEGVGEG